jgi:hypothetical protein
MWDSGVLIKNNVHLAVAVAGRSGLEMATVSGCGRLSEGG